MEPDRVDLSPLDPAEDQLHYERLIRRITMAAAPELARRAEASAPLALLGAWARPALAAAAIIAALATGAIVATDRAPASPGAASLTEMGLPDPAAGWLAEGREPTEADLVLAMEARD